MDLFARIRKLFKRPASNAGWPAEKASGPVFETITIAQDGTKYVSIIGWRQYGRGQVPPGGHKPTTIIEYEGTETTCRGSSRCNASES